MIKMLNKDKFYKAIDFGDHLNTRTKEAYWKHFTEKCEQHLQLLYKEENAPFQENTGIHQYIQLSIDKFFNESKIAKGPEINEARGTGPEDSKISPIDKNWKKESTTTWGTNDDVKFK
jgi:hypothetical protein